MLNDVNLVPQTEVVEQIKTKAIKSTTIFSIIVLVITLGVGIYYFVNLTDLNSKITQTDNDIESLRGKIRSMSEIEVSARNLGKKFRALEGLFSQRPRYSLLLNEISARKPDEVTMQSLDVKTSEISVSGVSTSYFSVAELVNNFLDTEYERGNPDLKDMFTAVTLNSVSLDSSTNSVKFMIIITYQPSNLMDL